jgi:hypothetical protein
VQWSGRAATTKRCAVGCGDLLRSLKPRGTAGAPKACALLTCAKSSGRPPHLLQSQQLLFSQGSTRNATMMLRSEQLTLREALASNQLEDFVRQEQARGVELAKGSELERALALLVTQRRIECRPACRM